MRRRRAGALVVLATLLLLVGGAWWLRAGPAQQVAVFDSPDGRFRVVVMRERGWRGAMPGQGSDSPGHVLLTDRDGRELQRAAVPMVQLVERVDWLPDRVSIKLIADWALPRVEGSARPAPAASAAAR